MGQGSRASQPLLPQEYLSQPPPPPQSPRILDCTGSKDLRDTPSKSCRPQTGRRRSRPGEIRDRAEGQASGLLLPCWGVSLPRLPHLPGPCTPNLDSEVLGHHAVPGVSEVSMHKLVGSKVGHAIRNLTSHLIISPSAGRGSPGLF